MNHQTKWASKWSTLQLRCGSNTVLTHYQKCDLEILDKGNCENPKLSPPKANDQKPYLKNQNKEDKRKCFKVL